MIYSKYIEYGQGPVLDYMSYQNIAGLSFFYVGCTLF